MMKRILVVEDDDHLADGIVMNLKLEGYDPADVDTAEEALRLLEQQDFHLILLDVMLPGMNGFTCCRILRERGDRTPVLFLTARDRDEDRIRGLEEGGDDYITKPFVLRELLARVASVFRREDWLRDRTAPDQLVIGNCRVNTRTLEAETPAGSVPLKEKEVMILKLLAERDGEPVDRETIIDRVWSSDTIPTQRTVDNFIVSLRKTLEPDPRRPRYLLTVHGRGYRLVHIRNP